MAEEFEKPHVNGTSPTDNETVDDDAEATLPRQQKHAADPDAQEMVISSLRSQIQDLFSQVNELNNKLVKSYDRVSDLEDDLHAASSNHRSSTLKISQLELERTQHLSALNTGLLVEKSHVTTELNRLMEKATEEAAQRGQAESARIAIEKDLDDLSASLFGQANTMVAEARYAQYLSERKVDDAQRALKGAEEAVSSMQSQMQLLQAEKEEAEKKTQEMQAVTGKGKWVQRRGSDISRPLKLLSFHAPYQEFLLFVAHIRSLHLTSPTPPAMPTLLPLPFLARLSNEDSEPSVRLDLAPSLNWLSRRSVLAAIHTGQLTIEPIPITSLFSELNLYSSPTTVAGINSTNDNVSCALCGNFVLTASEQVHGRFQRPPSHPLSTYPNAQSWSGSFFKRTSISSSHPPSPTHSNAPIAISAASSQGAAQQVYIFRVASQPSSTIASLPIPSLAKSLSQSNNSFAPSHNSSYNGTPNSVSPSNQPITIYPLCSSNWCLRRLRATCTLWAFVRTGIVEKVWEEEIPFIPPPSIVPPAVNGEKPPIPPRKRGLWGIASAIGERAASWSDSDKDKSKKTTPPPSAPTALQKPAIARKLPPPPPPESQTTSSPSAFSTPSSGPPPLPKRSEGRHRILTVAGGTPNQSNPSNPSTPTKVVFDAEVSASPIRTRHDEHAAFQPPERLGTPSSYPLPESRPTSPPSNANEPPVRIASPATIGINVAAATPPPPLPRRAAARAIRPVVAGDNASRPTTPASPTILVEQGKKPADGAEHRDEPIEEKKEALPTTSEDKLIEGSPQNTVEIINGTSVEETKSSNDTAGGKKEEEPVDRSIQGSPLSDDVFVDAPSPGKLGTNGTTPEPLSKSLSELAVTEEATTVTQPSPTKASEDTKNTKEERSKVEDVEASDDKQVYVGDATWEERTWKELIRLKEDMFWARIGGSR